MNPAGTWGKLIDLRSRFTMLTSPELVAEMIRIVSGPELERKLKRIVPSSPPARLLAILAEAEVVEGGEPVAVCMDPDDDKLFACALAGSADYIVSEDKDVLAVGEFRGARTITAADFLALLESQ